MQRYVHAELLFILYHLLHVHPLGGLSGHIENTPCLHPLYFISTCYTNHIGQVTCLTSIEESKLFVHVDPVLLFIYILPPPPPLSPLTYFPASSSYAFPCFSFFISIPGLTASHIELNWSYVTTCSRYIGCKFKIICLRNWECLHSSACHVTDGRHALEVRHADYSSFTQSSWSVNSLHYVVPRMIRSLPQKEINGLVTSLVKSCH